jgi:hypothetical protein
VQRAVIKVLFSRYVYVIPYFEMALVMSSDGNIIVILCTMWLQILYPHFTANSD